MASAGSAEITSARNNSATHSSEKMPYRMAILEAHASGRCNYHRLLADETPSGRLSFAANFERKNRKLLGGSRNADRDGLAGVGPLHDEVQGNMSQDHCLLVIGRWGVFGGSESQIALRGAASKE